MSSVRPAENQVLSLADIDCDALERLLDRYRIKLEYVRQGGRIPGSFWGESEAGLLADRVLARADTPLHSVLHEACHYVCMSEDRRCGLDTDAGGDYDEENAVCYLQILLADYLPGVGRRRLMQDMDAWGYSFRLGSARAWFSGDAADARAWLRVHELINEAEDPTWKLRRQAQA